MREIKKSTEELLHKIIDKYIEMGQNPDGYLEGLLYQNQLDYWDYIQTEVLLNLQVQRTTLPDEMIFIVYHQITELYFKLILWEIKQIQAEENLTASFVSEKLRRMCAYFRNLTKSFEIMIDGMEKEQFLKFRMGLLPASGFQSAQYRLIEIASTEIIQITDKTKREELKNKPLEEQLKYLYWRYGATETDTGKKTLTLQRFEEKYNKIFRDWAEHCEGKNLKTLLLNTIESFPEIDRITIKDSLKEFDKAVNVDWPMVHIKSAARYLKPEKGDAVAATGGTNWQTYLPPRFQRRVFYPELWSVEELENWGKNS